MAHTYTLEQVKTHTTHTSCWIAIHGDVFDVTKFLDEHPGGPDILLEHGGKDASADFDSIGHSESAKQLMAKYRIGHLAGYHAAPGAQKTRAPPAASGSAAHGAAYDGAANEEAAREAFRTFDTDNSGAIDATELQSLAYSLGELLTEEETKRMISEIDLDGDSLIQFNEWFAWWKQPRSRRLTSPQADPKLEAMRLQLLGKYAIDKVVNTVDSLRRSATNTPVPAQVNPNEPVELTFRVGVGKVETVRSTVHITSVIPEASLPPHIMVEFPLKNTHCTLSEIENLKVAAEELMATAAQAIAAKEAAGARAKAPPADASPTAVAHAPLPPSPVRFVDVQNNCLRVSFPLPSNPKTQQQLGALAMVPPGVNFDIMMKSAGGLHAPAGEIPACSIEAKLMLTRQSLVILKGFAAMAGDKGEGAAAALSALEYLNRFAIDIEFKDLTNWVTQTAKIPPEALNPAQSIAMVQEKLKVLLAGDTPPQKTAVKFLKAATHDGLLSGISKIKFGMGARDLIMEFTGFELFALVPPLP